MSDREMHLGDGVYASNDGYQIWLAVNHHTNKVVAIDSGVFCALALYAAEVWAPPAVARELRAVADKLDAKS